MKVPELPAGPRVLSPWVTGVAVGGLLLLATILRLPGLFTDLWLDELWSLRIAAELRGPLDVFSEVHHDGNHWLNTLALYAIGDGAPAWAYRLHSLLAGVLSVVLAGLIGRRQGRLEGLLALIFTAVCFPLVFYASEARGYALMIAFVLAAWLFLLRYADGGRGLDRTGYWLCALGGFLSHLAFVHAFAGFALWSLFVLRRSRGEDPGRTRLIPIDLAGTHLIPLVGVGVLWWVDLRHLEFGGGPPHSLAQVLSNSASLALGGPDTGWAAWLAAAAALGVLGVELVLLRRAEGNPRRDRNAGLWVFYATAIVGFPLALTLAVRPSFLFPRYYLVGIALFQLVLAGAVARALRARGARQKAALVAAFLVLCFHDERLRRFWTFGRGHYAAGLAHIVGESEGPRLVLGSDHDFRNGMLVEHHRRGLPEAPRLVYREQADWPAEGGDWWLLHRLGPEPAPLPEEVRDPAGHRYAREPRASFPSVSLSGASWYFYRRVRAIPDAPEIPPGDEER